MYDSEQKRRKFQTKKQEVLNAFREIVLSLNENRILHIQKKSTKRKNDSFWKLKTIADVKTSIEWVEDEVEEIFQSGAKRQRQKIGEKIRVRNLVQECIISKQKDFYKEKTKQTNKHRKMEGTKIKEIIHENFHIFKDIYQQTEGAMKCPAQWVKPDPRPISEILEHW